MQPKEFHEKIMRYRDTIKNRKWWRASFTWFKHKRALAKFLKLFTELEAQAARSLIEMWRIDSNYGSEKIQRLCLLLFQNGIVQLDKQMDHYVAVRKSNNFSPLIAAWLNTYTKPDSNTTVITDKNLANHNGLLVSEDEIKAVIMAKFSEKSDPKLFELARYKTIWDLIDDVFDNINNKFLAANAEQEKLRSHASALKIKHLLLLIELIRKYFDSEGVNIVTLSDKQADFLLPVLKDELKPFLARPEFSSVKASLIDMVLHNIELAKNYRIAGNWPVYVTHDEFIKKLRPFYNLVREVDDCQTALKDFETTYYKILAETVDRETAIIKYGLVLFDLLNQGKISDLSQEQMSSLKCTIAQLKHFCQRDELQSLLEELEKKISCSDDNIYKICISIESASIALRQAIDQTDLNNKTNQEVVSVVVRQFNEIMVLYAQRLRNITSAIVKWNPGGLQQKIQNGDCTIYTNLSIVHIIGKFKLLNVNLGYYGNLVGARESLLNTLNNALKNQSLFVDNDDYAAFKDRARWIFPVILSLLDENLFGKFMGPLKILEEGMARCLHHASGADLATAMNLFDSRVMCNFFRYFMTDLWADKAKYDNGLVKRLIESIKSLAENISSKFQEALKKLEEICSKNNAEILCQRQHYLSMVEPLASFVKILGSVKEHKQYKERIQARYNKFFKRPCDTVLEEAGVTYDDYLDQGGAKQVFLMQERKKLSVANDFPGFAGSAFIAKAKHEEEIPLLQREM